MPEGEGGGADWPLWLDADPHEVPNALLADGCPGGPVGASVHAVTQRRARPTAHPSRRADPRGERTRHTE